MNKFSGLFLIGLMLTGCSQTTIKQPTATKTLETLKTTSTPVITKAIDWSKIDKPYKNIVINDFPSTSPEAMKNMINLAAKGMNVSQSQALRILFFPSAIHEEGVIQEIQNQLGDDFAHDEWGFATPDKQAVTSVSSSANDEYVIKNYRLLIITKPNVKAETHIYTFKNGYTLPIQILPIAKWTDSQLSELLNDKNINKRITRLIASYGGEIQTLGIGSMQTPMIDIYFPNGNPNQAVLDQLTQKLHLITNLNIVIQATGKLHLD